MTDSGDLMLLQNELISIRDLAVPQPQLITKEFAIEKAKGEQGTEIKGIASAEIVDSMGDVISVAGMSWPRHSEESPIKILASHFDRLGDGTPPVIGVVTSLRRGSTNYKGKSVPAVLFTMKWADTALAQEYKQLYETGFMESFSVGCIIKHRELRKDKDGNAVGWHLDQTELFEISAVAIPANPAAIIRKALGGTMEIADFGALLKGIEAKQNELLKSIETLQLRVDEIAAFSVDLDASDSQAHQVPNAETKATETDYEAAILEIQKISKRLDGLYPSGK